MPEWLDDLRQFDFDGLQSFADSDSARSRTDDVGLTEERKLITRVERRAYRRMLTCKNAVECLERLPERGEIFHVVMSGRFHGWALVPAVLELARPAKIKQLTVATLGFNDENVDSLLELLNAKQIRQVDFVCSHFFRHSTTDVFERLHGELTARGHRVAAVRSHAKLLLFEMTDGRAYVIESSANLRSCNNAEQFSLTIDRELLEFHRAWLSDLIEETERVAEAVS